MKYKMISVQNHLEKREYCTAITLAWDRAPQLGENSKEKKNIGEPSELRGSLGTREKVPRDLFMPFHTTFPISFPTAEPGQDTISLETILVQPEVNKLDSVY